MIRIQDYETTVGAYHPVFDEIYLPFAMFRVIRGSVIATDTVRKQIVAITIRKIAVSENN